MFKLMIFFYYLYRSEKHKPKRPWVLWLVMSKACHSCIFVTNHSFEVRQEDTWPQGQRVLVLDNGAQRAVAPGSAGGQRNRQIKVERC